MWDCANFFFLMRHDTLFKRLVIPALISNAFRLVQVTPALEAPISFLTGLMDKFSVARVARLTGKFYVFVTATYGAFAVPFAWDYLSAGTHFT
jgi:hypothetical protein